jgi:methyltransferase
MSDGLSGTVLAYALLVGAVAAERGFELLLSRRNLRRVAARGGLVADRRSFWDMAVLQAGFLVACPLEVLLLDRPFVPGLGLPMLALVVLAMALRYWAVATLGDRGNVRLVVLPGEPVVAGGPYRRVRHPNYLAVVVETVALPLVHTAWLTACVSAALLAPVLRTRIRREEAALARHTDWVAAFAERGRLLP